MRAETLLSLPLGFQESCLYIKLDSELQAREFVKEQSAYLKRLACALDLEIRVSYGNSYFPIRRPPSNSSNFRSIQQQMTQLIQRYPFINGPLLGGLDYDTVQKLADEVSRQTKPCFLVSMDRHRNLMCNQAALEMMESSPEELFNKSLAKMWVPPNQLTHINYEVYLPPHLQEFHRLLKQAGTLNDHKYRGWKNNGDDSKSIWVEWCTTISYRGIESYQKVHNCRLMVCSGFEEVSPNN